MPAKTFAPLLAILLLLLAALACTHPYWYTFTDDVPPTAFPSSIDIPTAAPTPAPGESDSPTPAPPDFAALPAEDTIITSQGALTNFGPSPDLSCQNPQPLTLTVHPDGSAELTTTSPSFIDHTNCTQGSSTETWFVNGTVTATETVSFTSCNYGNFTASGSMSYSGGVLSGEVSCANKDGLLFVTLSVR